MEDNKNCQYYVVELINPQFTGFDRYIIVPDFWMQFRDYDTQTAIVKYPKEDTSTTQKRVEEKENFSTNWPVFHASVKFGTDSYKEAENYIIKLTNYMDSTETEEKDCDPTTPEVHLSSSAVNRVINYSLLSETSEILTTEEASIQLLNDSSINEVAGNSINGSDKNTEEYSKLPFTSNNNRNKPPENNENQEIFNVLEKRTLNFAPFDSDFLNRIKKMQSFLENTHQQYDRLLNECKKQSIIAKNIVKLVESTYTDSTANNKNILETEAKENNESGEPINDVKNELEREGKNSLKSKNNDVNNFDNVSLNNVDTDNGGAVDIPSNNSENLDGEGKDECKDRENLDKAKDKAIIMKDQGTSQNLSMSQSEEHGNNHILEYCGETQIREDNIMPITINFNISRRCNCRKTTTRDSFFEKIY